MTAIIMCLFAIEVILVIIVMILCDIEKEIKKK